MTHASAKSSATTSAKTGAETGVKTLDQSASSALILLRDDRDGIAVLTLNRPAARNSLSEDMLEALGDALTAIAHDETVRVVILAANGPAFSAGHDLKELNAHRTDEDHGRAYFKHVMGLCSTLMQQVVALPQPVIAAVEATATAAGCQLVASCDLAIAGDGAKFGTPGVNIGLFCSTPMVALSRNIARKHAMEMLLTGELIPAEEALGFGLINRIVPQGTALEEAMKLAELIASKSALTVKTGKEAFYRQAEMTLAEAYRYTSEVMVENMLARDAAEGIKAFIDKRPPRWQDR